jgi:hypothetical protein
MHLRCLPQPTPARVIRPKTCQNSTVPTSLEHPFVIGLLVGLFVCSVVWVRGWLDRRALHREIEELKNSLFTKLKIETKAQVTMDGELAALKQQNENLRITVSALQQKAGRAELRQLHVYDRALHMMLASAPGFAPAWEDVVQRAEAEMREAETGVGAFVRKVFVAQLPARKSEKGPDALPRKEESEP